MTRLLIPSAVMPHPAHSVRAANVVIEQLLRALADTPDVQPVFLPVFPGASASFDPDTTKALRDLAEAGVEMADPLILPAAVEKPLSRTGRLFDRTLERFQPLAAFSEQASAAVRRCKADWVMTIWSEPLTALFAKTDAKKFAYYGNPDPKNFRAGFGLQKKSGAGLRSSLRHWVHGRHLEAAHLEMMRSWDIIGDVAALDAKYYLRSGHPHSVYIQNVWIDRFGWPEVKRRHDEAEAGKRNGAPVEIVASIGKVAGTANTYGLLYLVNELLPELRRVFASKPFELHIFGSGAAHPLVAPLLKQKEIVLRGFVDDLDDEMIRKPIFLCVNNATEYNVGHTRYLHAFTMGSCVVASSNTSLAMPEIEHGVNALLGKNAAEIAEYVRLAADDVGLRRRLGEAGYDTYDRVFRATTVARRIAGEINA